MPEPSMVDPTSYSSSYLHSSSRVFPETNCYTDLWIELLHARGLEPVAMMSFCLAVDFEGDQWTFFKPPPSELALLYGIDVHEMQVYRSLLEHAHDQLALGRSIIIEVDAFYLPDTQGTSYRQVHQKTSIAIEKLDLALERLTYFHARGLHEITGSDFRNLFHLDCDVKSYTLPPYVELVRFDAGVPLVGSALQNAAYEGLARQMCHLPENNPWQLFGNWLMAELQFIIGSSPERYHACAFATVRQAGAAFELAQSFIDWAFRADAQAHAVSAGLKRQADGAKILLLKLSRQRIFDVAQVIGPLAAAYEDTVALLKTMFNRSSYRVNARQCL